MKKRWIILIIVLLLILSGGTFFYFKWHENKNIKKPDELLQTYMKHIEKQDYSSMYDMLDQSSKLNYTKEKFITRNQKIYEGIGATTVKIRIDSTQDVSDGSKVVAYHTTLTTYAGEMNFDNEATFVKEDKEYRLEWDDNLIYPKLGKNDKIRITNVEAKRGSIYDCNGVMLAGEGIASSVGLVPGNMSKDPSLDIEQLAKLLNVSKESIEKKLSASWVKKDSFVPIKTIPKLEGSELTVDKISDETKEKKKLQDGLLTIKGLKIIDVKTRVYPFAEKMAHLIGYVQNITKEELDKDKEHIYDSNSQIGKVGLESLYEDRLRGTRGVEIDLVNSDGTTKEVLAAVLAEDGADIHLTIDSDIQSKVYAQYKKDKSATVVMNPKTGAILALVSTPSYDDNEFIRGISSESWKKLSEDEDKPMYNRFRATFVPGSSIKPIIGAIGLTTSKFSATESFGKSAKSWTKDKSWGGYKVTTLHTYDNMILKNALIYSDNIYFAKAALKIGSSSFMKELEKIGFKESYPFDIKLTASTYASGDNKIKSSIQLADSGYGQGQMLVNPVHMASIYSAFVNEGSMITPFIEAKSESSFYKENVFSKDAVNEIVRDLIQVIEDKHGTAHSGKLKGVTLAAKTGTSEIKASKGDKNGTELGWYAVFTPKADVKDSLLMVSMVEDVKDRGGSAYVVGKAKKILEKVGVK
ncbi:penicillin-binding protein 3 [Lachnospiraceae bacterium KM106-2]|nr:penicillin-binding protein 3 [Lachnospiraceae bacterium KM106-2]